MLVSTFQHGGGVQCSTLILPSASAQPRKAAGQKLLRQISLRGKESQFPTDSLPVLRFLNLDAVAVPPSWHSLERQCLSTKRGKKIALKKALSPRSYPIPYIPSTASCLCSITGTAFGRRFFKKAVNKFLADLFLGLPGAIAAENLPKTMLSRYDLHHAHLFCNQIHGLGLLFHSKEYIAAESGDVDVGNLGNCQIGTPLEFEREAMAWRNIVWLVINIRFLVKISNFIYLFDFFLFFCVYVGWAQARRRALM
jgi:hypothetical protein